MIKILHFLLDILFPCSCVNCGRWVRGLDYHLCRECRTDLKPAEKGCPVCGGMTDSGECPICLSRKVFMTGNIPVYEYGGSVKKLLHGLKFRSLRNAYRNFIPEMAGAASRMAVKPDLITFVPMSRRKLAERGYNQSGLIAQAIGRELGIPCVRTLRERGGFRSQRGLGRVERYINVIDRYKACSINKFRDRTILLVDDVFTTGSTINECSRQLLRCGAYAVYSITVARADPDKITT